jgi:hypothetical protein
MSSSFRDQFLSCCVAGFQREKAGGHFEEAEEREPGIKKTFSSPVSCVGGKLTNSVVTVQLCVYSVVLLLEVIRF